MLWFLIAGNLGCHKFDQFITTYVFSFFEYTNGLDGFTPFSIGNTYNGYFLNTVMSENGFFYFHRINVFASRFYEFFLRFSPCIPNKPIFIDAPKVTRVMPAIAKSISRICLQIPITKEYGRRPDTYLSLHSDGDFLIQIIKDCYPRHDSWKPDASRFFRNITT